MRLLRVLAIVIGSGWFFPVSCTTGAIVGTQVIAALDERDVQKGDQVHPRFKVAVAPGEQGKSFRVLRIDQVKALSNKAAAEPAAASVTFRMSAPTDSIQFEQSKFEYRVLEDTAQDQLIELVEIYLDGDNTIWSRYRATRTTVAPVSSRMFYFGYMFSALAYAFAGAFVLYGVGRLIRRRFAAPTAAKKDS